MFDGKMKVFRSEGGAVKTEDEKRQMAEKHRFKKNREFKQRITEQEENEEGDIRSFTFHRHDMFEQKNDRRPRESKESGKSGKSGYSGKAGKPARSGFSGKFSKSGKPARDSRPDKRNFGKKRNRFNDDDEDENHSFTDSICPDYGGTRKAIHP